VDVLQPGLQQAKPSARLLRPLSKLSPRCVNISDVTFTAHRSRFTLVSSERCFFVACKERTTSHWPWQSFLTTLKPDVHGKELPPFSEQTGQRDDNDPLVRLLTCQRSYPRAGGGLLGWPKTRAPLLDFDRAHVVPVQLPEVRTGAAKESGAGNDATRR
jgi:hypothetical protein